jgi:hypothetical protein
VLCEELVVDVGGGKEPIGVDSGCLCHCKLLWSVWNMQEDAP